MEKQKNQKKHVKWVPVVPFGLIFNPSGAIIASGSVYKPPTPKTRYEKKEKRKSKISGKSYFVKFASVRRRIPKRPGFPDTVT